MTIEEEDKQDDDTAKTEFNLVDNKEFDLTKAIDWILIIALIILIIYIIISRPTMTAQQCIDYLNQQGIIGKFN